MKSKFVLVSTICVLFSGNSVTQLTAASPQASNKELSQQLSQYKEKVKTLETEITRLQKAITSMKSLMPAPAPKKQEKYTIKEGETVTQIANRNGISRKMLMEVNQISENQQIYIGDELIIPAPPAPEKVEIALPVAAPVSKKLVKKEIPKPAPVSKPEKATLIAWTKPEQKKVEAPKVKVVSLVKTDTKPEATKPSSPKKENPHPELEIAKSTSRTPNNQGFTYYTIQFGDNLGKIAKKHGISVGALMSLNGITNPNKISGGQKLKIPSKEAAKSISKVKPAPAPKVASSSSDKPLPGDTHGIYIVESGDNLYDLAHDFYTTQKEIQTLNKMGDKTNIVPGQNLIVPTAEYFRKSDLANN